MELQFTEEAIRRMDEVVNDDWEGKGIKLYYDTEGCGCGVDGIFTIWITREQKESDLLIETNYRPVLIEKGHEVFFDESMKIDRASNSLSLQLKSPNQILNPRMAIVDRTRK